MTDGVNRPDVMMASVKEVLNKLKAKAKPDQVEGMAKYGMTAKQRLEIKLLLKQHTRSDKLIINLHVGLPRMLLKT